MQSCDSVGNLELLCAFVNFPIAVSHPQLHMDINNYSDINRFCKVNLFVVLLFMIAICSVK